MKQLMLFTLLLTTLLSTTLKAESLAGYQVTPHQDLQGHTYLVESNGTYTILKKSDEFVY